MTLNTSTDDINHLLFTVNHGQGGFVLFTLLNHLSARVVEYDNSEHISLHHLKVKEVPHHQFVSNGKTMTTFALTFFILINQLYSNMA